MHPHQSAEIDTSHSSFVIDVIDVTGPIQEGMWNYEPPFPVFHRRPLPPVPWVDTPVYCDIFEGIHSQTGTYLETPAHLLGEQSYLLDQVPVHKLVNIPARVLQLSGSLPGCLSASSPAAGRQEQETRPPVTAALLEAALNGEDIPPQSAILVSTGWGKRWMEPDYLSASPYFTTDAMEWIVDKRPFLLGADLPRWENLERPQNIFPLFYDADILMLAPLVRLEKLPAGWVRLTALPLAVTGSCCVPCRAVVTGF